MRARDYQPGQQVPGTVYKVLRLIGAGGMGTVYDVEDTTIGKRYVLKTLHPRLGNREDMARRIQTEARTLARLHHTNIVEVITAGVTADDLRLPYYLMERLSGQSLRVVLEKKGQLDLPHVYHIGIDLLDALDHAHDKGVVHRDVKPDNIFLHRTIGGVTVTKLIDFGIVSMLDANGGETAGRFLGTLRYAAPEQLRGEKPTPKTDVYAAGLVIYEILAGRGPFDDEGDAHKVAAAHMHKTPPPVSKFVRVPRELDALLSAALAKSPDARPRDAFSFAASLRNLKRADEHHRPRESTGNRVTASAVIGPVSSPALPQAAEAAEAGHGPRTSSSAGSVPAPPASVTPKTTLVGMPMPTASPGMALSQTSPFSVTAPTDPQSYRSSLTNSMAPDTQPTPKNGTEGFAPAWPPPLPAPSLDEPSTLIHWPREQPPIRSEEPQVRSLPAGPASRRVRRPMAIGAMALGALALIAGGFVGVVRRSPSPPKGADDVKVAEPASPARRSPTPPDGPAAIETPSPVPPSPAASPTPSSLPAPSPSPALTAIAATPIAPPSVESAPPAVRRAAAHPVSTAEPPLSAPAPSAKAPRPTFRPGDRPGPGF